MICTWNSYTFPASRVTFMNAVTLESITNYHEGKLDSSADSWGTDRHLHMFLHSPWKACLHCGSTCVSGASFDLWTECYKLYIPSTDTQTPGGEQRGNQHEWKSRWGRGESLWTTWNLWSNNAADQLSKPICYYIKSKHANVHWSHVAVGKSCVINDFSVLYPSVI